MNIRWIGGVAFLYIVAPAVGGVDRRPGGRRSTLVGDCQRRLSWSGSAALVTTWSSAMEVDAAASGSRKRLGLRVLERLSIDIAHGRHALLVAFLGALLSPAVYLSDYWLWGDTDGFTATPEFVVWMLLICGQSATWAVLVPILARCHLDLRGYWRGHGRGLAASAFVFLFLIAVFANVSAAKLPPTPLPHLTTKIAILSIVPIVIALAGGLGIWLVHVGLDREFGHRRSTEKAVDRFLRLRDQLRTLLLAEAALLSVSVVGTGALRSAIIAWDPSVDLSPTWIILYGIFFSVLLAAAYLPTHVRLMAVGHRLREDVVGSRPPPQRGWRAWQEERVAVGDYLELQAPGTPALRAFGAVLSPLATALITAALGVSP